MVSSQIDNLKLTNVTEDILLVHQIKPPFRFSCCDGLLILPKRGRNSNTIALDVNIEPHLINKLNEKYGSLTGKQIKDLQEKLSDTEKMVTDYILKLMETEDNQEYEEPYLDGLHFTLNQPELARNHLLSQALTELIEQRNLVKNILPSDLQSSGVEVIIGRENDADSIKDYSVVISQYGLPEEAEGTVFVIGPTRMPYGRTIATVGYISDVLSRLVARLYGRQTPDDTDSDIVQ